MTAEGTFCEITSSRSNFLVTTVRESIRSGSGCHVIIVDLKKVQDVDVILFRNFYSFSISVFFKQLYSRSWLDAVIDFRLMIGGSQCEQNAQTWFTLTHKHFTRTIQGASKLMIILRQPSPHWNKFGIDDMVLYHHDNCCSHVVPDGSTLAEYVSSKVHRMCIFENATEKKCDKHYSDISLLATD